MVSRRRNRAFSLVELLLVIAILFLLAAILFPVFSQAREKARQTTCASNLKQISLGMLQYVQDFDECYPGGSVVVPSMGSGYFWPNWVLPYVQTTVVFNCPDLEGWNHVANGYANPPNIGDRLDYAFNVSLSTTGGNPSVGESIAKVNYPDQLIMLADGRGDGILGEDIGFNGAIGSAGFGSQGSWPMLWYSTLDASLYNSWVGPDCRHQNFANIAYADGHVKKLTYNTLYYPPAGVLPANFRLWHFDAQ